MRYVSILLFCVCFLRILPFLHIVFTEIEHFTTPMLGSLMITIIVVISITIHFSPVILIHLFVHSSQHSFIYKLRYVVVYTTVIFLRGWKIVSHLTLRCGNYHFVYVSSSVINYCHKSFHQCVCMNKAWGLLLAFSLNTRTQ